MQVLEVIGRPPMNKAEAARVKQEIYRANPGLLTAIVKAERDATRLTSCPLVADPLFRGLWRTNP